MAIINKQRRKAYAEEEPTKRSDIDVCMVKPSEGILDDVHGKLGGKYDVKVFENLPLYVKMGVIMHHEVIYGDELDLSEYFYFFRKLWRDMEYRIARNELKDFAERMGYRRRWLNEKEKILREAGERKDADEERSGVDKCFGRKLR